jgi:hypothetical protein
MLVTRYWLLVTGLRMPSMARSSSGRVVRKIEDEDRSLRSLRTRTIRGFRHRFAAGFPAPNA